MTRIKILFLIIVLTFTGCAIKPETLQVGRYESSSWGFNTNTWWVEGPDGVVLINTQFLPSAIKEAVEIAESYTGKKVVLAFVLHANPDKFNGTGYLLSRGIQVISSEQVINTIPEVDKLRRSWFYERYKPDYPEKLTLPQSAGTRNTSIEAAGLKFKIHVLGPSVSKNHIAIQAGSHVFVGDIIANKHHSWLELGLVDEWLSTLTYIESLNPEFLYPGRGYASGKILIKKQSEYLQSFVNSVKNIKNKGRFNESQKQAVIDEFKLLYPDYGNAFFLNLNVEPVWNSLKGTSIN